MSDEPDWVQWHRPYDDPDSGLSRRLALVQQHVRRALDTSPPGPVRVLSLCAGRGRDVIDVLVDHPRRADVVVTLVELQPDLADAARAGVRAAGLTDVHVITGDASTTDTFRTAVPADVVLLCGIFGNVSDEDVRDCIGAAPTLCHPGATVIWTRHRLEPDLTPAIRAWFADAGFDEVAFGTPDGNAWAGVGAHRLTAAPGRFVSGRRLFTFVGDGRGSIAPR
ncbi:MAG: class I SAM-dependent methyltransferase family protein [Acidimicrobiia bacterium]